MVYCGKPSRACLDCRVKRRRCDLSKPSCGQCVRARSTCSGYRDQVALAFRDQSADVVRRARSLDGHSKRHVPPNSNDLSSVKMNHFRQRATTHDLEKHLEFALYPGIAFSIEKQAASFFFHHYIANEATLSKGHIDCLEIICGRASATGYLLSIIDAIGIASLSNLKREPNLMYAANRKFSQSLEKVRLGLEEPAEAISDQMLVCVMLFTLYETVTCSVTHSISSWTKHVDGALTLVQLRGMDQLNSKTGRHLLFQLRTEVLVSSLQLNTPVPQVMLNWMSEAQKFEIGENLPSSRLANIIANICALRAATNRYRNAVAINELDLSQYISEALSIDADLAKWSATLPSLYKYSATSMAIGQEDLYPGLCHNYSSLWVAHIWNIYRCARILLNQTITKLITLHLQLISFVPGISSYGFSLDTSSAVILECTTNIFLSVPFILGDFQREQNASPDLRAVCGLSLLWPLYVASAACPAQQPLRKWAIVQLERIGNKAGIQKAKIIVMMLGRMDAVYDSR